MAFLSYTYIFANSTTADANQVNTNLQDVIDATSDGTIDFNINGLTVAGSAALNGAVTLGNGTPDDIQILGSLAANIPIKANSTYGIGGATLGLSGIYFGGTSSFTTRIIAAATASWTLTLPPTAGIASQVPVNSGAGVTTWQPYTSSLFGANYGISATVATNALTIALKNAGVSGDPSATDPVTLSFRNATLTTGDYSLVSATAATSVVIPSGATMGWTSGDTRPIFVYALNNAGAVELVVCSQMLDESALQTTTAISSSASSLSVPYSTSARTSKAVRYLGEVYLTEATAGTWATAPAKISLCQQPKAATALSDSEATRLGLKSYVHGGSYNNSLAPTITLTSGGGTLSSVNLGEFVPYQIQDATWRMRFNLKVTLSSAGRSGAVLGVAGVTTYNGAEQVCSGYLNGTATPLNAFVESNDTKFSVVMSTNATTTSMYMSGDIKLASKPLWTY